MMKAVNPQLIKLMTILNDGGVHDGDALGQALSVSRAAIWKMINKLKEYGVKIDSTKAKGYQLTTPLMLLSQEKIAAAFKEDPIHITCLERVSSTNDFFKSQDQQHPIFQVCLAEMQTKGRGRLGRNWFSPFGQNLYLSCRYFFQKDVSDLGGLSLAVGIAIISALKQLGFDHDIMLKWPNDVMYQGKKFAGILIEVRAETHGLSEVVIGVGMNVNAVPDVSAKITQNVSALSEISGQKCDRNDLAIALIKQLVANITRFEVSGFAAFAERWKEVDYLHGEAITLLQGDHYLPGIAQGVNDNGYLLLQQGDGVRAFSSGEVSVAKL